MLTSVLIAVALIAAIIIIARMLPKDDFETEEKDLYLRWLAKQDNRTRKGKSKWLATKKQDSPN